MKEGLIIALIGMGAVFVSLTIIMFLMIGMERIFRKRGMSVHESMAVGWGVAGLGMEREAGVESLDAVEVAAITLALASYMKERGKQLGTSVVINGLCYKVEVGDTTCSPVSVVVSGESHLACLDGEGLPVIGGIAPMPIVQIRDTQHAQVWRSVHPLAQGGYWDRRGWSGGKG